MAAPQHLFSNERVAQRLREEAFIERICSCFDGHRKLICAHTVQYTMKMHGWSWLPRGHDIRTIGAAREPGRPGAEAGCYGSLPSSTQKKKKQKGKGRAVTAAERSPVPTQKEIKKLRGDMSSAYWTQHTTDLPVCYMCRRVQGHPLARGNAHKSRASRNPPTEQQEVAGAF